jgi:AhpD family alkylhydroperoxidase
MFIQTVPESTATGELADYYAHQRAGWGFLPDYARAFSSRPDVAAAWNALNLAIRGGMDRRLFELVTIAAARALRSTYCTTAHSKFLRDVCADQATLDALAQDPSGGTLSTADRQVYAFATKVAIDAASVSQADVDARAFFTTVLDGLGAQLDPETPVGATLEA